jgi:hypothetical protein
MKLHVIILLPRETLDSEGLKRLSKRFATLPNITVTSTLWVMAQPLISKVLYTPNNIAFCVCKESV